MSIFERITIIGLGLVGGSIARAAREYKLADIIVGCDTNQTTLSYARSQEIIDVPSRDPRTAVEKSQLVILATPPSAYESITRAMASGLSKGTIVMDTGSVKRASIRAISMYLPTHVDFIPAHPVAGSEQSGIGASRADLFQKQKIIITPAEPVISEALQVITSFWKGMGARIEGMPADMHDMIYAYVSHLPHLLAYAASSMFSEDETNLPSLQKFLRLAKSNTDLWSELFYLNNDNLIAALDRYIDATSHVQQELSQAPDDAPNKTDGVVARTVLFPRIAASCLITTVMEAEKKAGIPFARFAGSGFADFTSPASLPPDEDIETISDTYADVAKILLEYNKRLVSVHDMLTRHQYTELTQVLSGK